MSLSPILASAGRDMVIGLLYGHYALGSIGDFAGWIAKYVGAYTSSESSGLSFGFHEFEDVSDSDGALDVADEMSLVGLLSGDEDNLHLGDATSRSGSSQKLSDSGLDGF